MKISSLLLASLSAALLTTAACTKKDGEDPQPVTNPEEVSNDGRGDHPDYCPACGMG